MLRSLENLIGYQIHATNGAMGTVADFFFLDDSWKVRYVVVAAGGWLNRRRVLLSTDVIGDIDDSQREFTVALSRERIRQSPDVESDMPVSRQNEVLLARHYGWQPYWTPDPFFAGNVPSERLEVNQTLEGSDPHLRSVREITTYSVCYEAGEKIGYGTDLIVEDGTWHINGLIASPSKGRLEDAVCIPPHRVGGMDWTRRKIRISAGEPGSSLAPFDPGAPVNPRPVIRYYDYTGRLHHSKRLPELREGTY